MARLLYAALVGFLLVLALAEIPVASPAQEVQHVVVIVQENHSFDNFFGFYPGANGLQGSNAPIFHATTNDVYENQSIDGFVGHPENYGYFTCADIPYYCYLANEGVLFDNYFVATPLASLPNHMAMIAGSTLGFHTDWNTSGQAFPWRTNTTILDEMTAKGVSWDYFNCDYNECPLSFFKQSPGWFDNEQETPDLISDIKSHTLPDVSFVMPMSDAVSDEPPASLTSGQAWVKGVIDDLNSSGYLSSTVVLLTWDDSGGFFDHVQPPGSLGYRVPMIMLAPYGPEGFVDHDLSSHYSIPTVIESAFGLSCMHLDCSAFNLLSAVSSPAPVEPPTLTSTSTSSVTLTPTSTSTKTTTSAQSSTSTRSSTSTQATITTQSTASAQSSTSTQTTTSTRTSTSTETSTGCQAWATAYWGPLWGCENLNSNSAQSSTSTVTTTACQAWATAYWGPLWGCEDLD